MKIKELISEMKKKQPCAMVAFRIFDVELIEWFRCYCNRNKVKQVALITHMLREFRKEVCNDSKRA